MQITRITERDRHCDVGAKRIKNPYENSICFKSLKSNRFKCYCRLKFHGVVRSRIKHLKPMK